MKRRANWFRQVIILHGLQLTRCLAGLLVTLSVSFARIHIIFPLRGTKGREGKAISHLVTTTLNAREGSAARAAWKG